MEKDNRIKEIIETALNNINSFMWIMALNFIYIYTRFK